MKNETNLNNYKICEHKQFPWKLIIVKLLFCSYENEIAWQNNKESRIMAIQFFHLFKYSDRK